jgi:hypothetical protein
MVISPTGQKFLIDVKGLYLRNYWQVRSREPCEGLIYVFAFVPDEKPNRFFTMTQKQVNQAIKEHKKKYPVKNNYREGILWPVVEQHENWNALKPVRDEARRA